MSYIIKDNYEAKGSSNMPKSKMYNFSREEIKLAVDSSQTFKECLEKLGYKTGKNIITLKKIISEQNLENEFFQLLKIC